MKKRKPGEAAPRTWRDEIGLAQRHATLFLLALAAGAAAVAVSSWFLGEQIDTLVHATQMREAAAAKLRNVEIEKSEIRNFQPRFTELFAAGLVGDERRLDWTEAVRQIQAEYKLLPISFEFEPQQPVAMGTPVAMGDYQLRGSRMSIHMELLHEMDLFNFLAELRARSFYTIQECKIKRSEAPIESIKTARLLGDCTLNWITLGAAPTPVELPVAPLRTRGWIR